MNKDKYFVYNAEYDCWMHRTPLKCFVNPILRKIQFWTDKPFVIYSNCKKINGRWHFKGYGFGRIKYKKLKRINPPIISNEEYTTFQIADYFTNNKKYIDKIKHKFKMKSSIIDVACLCANYKDKNNLKKYFNHLSKYYGKQVRIRYIVEKQDLYGLNIKCLYISKEFTKDIGHLLENLDASIDSNLSIDENFHKYYSKLMDQSSLREDTYIRMFSRFGNKCHIIYGEKCSKELI